MKRIKAVEQLPEPGRLVLVYHEFSGYGLRARNSEGHWFDENNNFDDSGIEVTYWWPLPKVEEE